MSFLVCCVRPPRFYLFPISELLYLLLFFSSPPSLYLSLLILQFYILLFLSTSSFFFATQALRGDALDSWLAECNVTLSLFFLRLHTERLNALFHDAGHRWRHALSVWFSMGVAFGALAACYSLFLLVDNLWRTLTAPTGAPQMLTPVVPGVNLPMNRVLSYFVCLLVNSVWHEAGHALAAAAEHRRVQGFGVFLFGVYPGAYVEMGGDELASLSPLQQLRVVCAGAWHNITLAALVALVALAAPMLLSPWYYEPGGVVVVDVALQSPLRGHLLPGSVLTVSENDV